MGWFRILPGKDKKASSAFEIAGFEIAKEQATWKSQVTDGDAQILPHFSIEGFAKMDALKAILEKPMELAAEIAVLCEQSKFDGIVFDLRLALFRSLKPLIPRLVRSLSQALHGAQRRLILSVPALPMTGGKGPDFDAQDAAAVAGDVDAVLLGTRDFSRGVLGPSAPLPWIRASVNRLLGPAASSILKPSQIMIEIPLYGRAFPEGNEEEGGKVILTPEIAKALAKQRPKLKWDSEAREHLANITSKGSRIGL